MKFSIIYEDLSVYRGESKEDWDQAPTDGVQFIIPEKGQICCDHDIYYYNDGEPWQTDDAGPQMRKMGFKFGRTTSVMNYELARELAKKESDKYGR